MNWDGMFKKFGRKSKVAGTYPTTGDSVWAEPISDELVSEMVDRERFEVLKAENKGLAKQRDKAFDDGYENALKKVFDVIEERDGRVGKKQILSEVQRLMRIHREEK